MDPRPLDQTLLAVLSQPGAAGEITPGSLRTRLAKTLGGATPTAVEIQGRIHALWKEGRVAVEPPLPGQREIRLWPGGNGNSPSGAPPESKPTPEHPELFIQICTQLASAHLHARHPETKEEIARLLLNLGAVPSESPGSVTRFLGRRHLCSSPLLPGDPVRVVESGWLLRNCPGEHLLSKSRVTPA